jgi:hypothetical protein
MLKPDCESCELPIGSLSVRRRREDGEGEHTICEICFKLDKLGLIKILEMPDGSVKVWKP